MISTLETRQFFIQRKRRPAFRLYHKKRGGRSTSSQAAKAVSHTLWLASCLALGVCAQSLIVIWLVLPDWRVNHEFLPATARVLDKHVETEERDGVTVYRPLLQLEYEVAGTTFSRATFDIHERCFLNRQDAEQALLPFKSGENTTCWYDPLQPNQVVAVRGHARWVWLMVGLPIPLILVGLLGLALAAFGWGKSNEWRSAASQAAARSSFVRELRGGRELLPFVPRMNDLGDSPGVCLPYRLPSVAAPFWRLFGFAALGIFWNVAAAACLVQALTGALLGHTQLGLLVLAIPLLSVGGYLAYQVAKRIVAAMKAGTTALELDSPWLEPGRPTRAYLSQSGHLRLDYLEVWLGCDEVAVYRQGTDSRRESQRVFQSRQYHAEGIEIQPAVPYAIEFAVLAPQDSMHSFRSAHNAVEWMLEVHCKHTGGGLTIRAFPLVAAPLSPPPTLASLATSLTE